MQQDESEQEGRALSIHFLTTIPAAALALWVVAYLVGRFVFGLFAAPVSP